MCDILEATLDGNVNAVKETVRRDSSSVDSKSGSLGFTALHLTTINGDEELTEFLIEGGNANVNARDNGGFSPLHHAASNGHSRIVKILLEHGADIDAENKNGKTPLQYARKNAWEEIVRILLEHGAKSA